MRTDQQIHGRSLGGSRNCLPSSLANAAESVLAVLGNDLANHSHRPSGSTAITS